MRHSTLGSTVLAVALLTATGAAHAQDPRLPAGAAGTVTIPRPDYDRLLDLVATRRPGGETPPVDAALIGADLRVRIADGIARATIRIDGEVFRTGTVKVPLVAGATLVEATMGNRPLPLIVEQNKHAAVLDGPSTFSVTLEWAAPIVTTPGRATFTVPVPAAGSAIATFEVPGTQTDVRITPGLILGRTSENGVARIEAALTPGVPAQVSWSTRETAPAAAKESRTIASVDTLITIGEADLRLVTVLDLTVVQGDPSEFDVTIPAGYDVAGVSGASLDRTDERPGHVVLFVRDPAQRRHQFLISLERTHAGGSLRLETGVPTVAAAQRESGDIAIDGSGTLELAASEVPGLRRIDVREVKPVLAATARYSLLAAYRYQRGSAAPVLALDVARFADAPVLAAVAERAVATTLVTSEGRALTEISLWVRNRAQSFVKVTLPSGSTVLSAQVAGEPAKPVEGTDGTRVPLLRPGFRTDAPYQVSFVYLHTGTPFLKKGAQHMVLPKMDLPVNMVEWELFVPERYRVDRFDGNAIAAEAAPAMVAFGGPGIESDPSGVVGPVARGQIVGRVTDSSGGAIPGANVTVSGSGSTQSVTTDSNGRYVVSGVPSGSVTVTGQLTGFGPSRNSFVFDQRPRQADLVLTIGTMSETVTVTAGAPLINTSSSSVGAVIRTDEQAGRNREALAAPPSVNVQNLQRLASGVLPVRMDVPRAGTSHRFVKPLVIDEETTVSFRYRRR